MNVQHKSLRGDIRYFSSNLGKTNKIRKIKRIIVVVITENREVDTQEKHAEY